MREGLVWDEGLEREMADGEVKLIREREAHRKV